MTSFPFFSFHDRAFALVAAHHVKCANSFSFFPKEFSGFLKKSRNKITLNPRIFFFFKHKGLSSMIRTQAQ